MPPGTLAQLKFEMAYERPLPPAASEGSLTHHPELRLHEWNFASIRV